MPGTKVLGLVAAVAMLVLAGCSGKPGTTDARIGDNGAAPNAPNPPVVTEPQKLGDDFTAHHHDYWGGRSHVIVFDGDVALQTFPLDSLTYEGCNAIGHATFNFEDDGNDVGPGDPPVRPDNQHADVIFPGTVEILTRIGWADPDPGGQQDVPGLQFAYKPANEALYTREMEDTLPGGPCGVVVPKDKEFAIPVKPFQFDPAHQVALSRWTFKIWSYQPGATNGGVDPPAVGLGIVHVHMEAINGGTSLLDPPHPDFFAKGDPLNLGTSDGTVNFTVVADPDLGAPRPVTMPTGYTDSNGQELSDITLPRGSIVPLLTERLEVTACVQYKGGSIPAPPGIAYGLAYHGAETQSYAPIAPDSGSGDCQHYTIPDPQGVKMDSPYETVSQWGFRIVPATGGETPLGWFQGTYEFSFLAHKRTE